MRIVTLSEVETDLQNLADQVGADGFAKAKALYFEKVAVTKEDGTPLSAEDVDIVLVPKADANEEEEKANDDDETEDKMEDEDEKEKPKALRIETRRKAMATAAAIASPATVRPKTYGRLRFFSDDANGDAVQKAARFGHWLLASRGIRKSLNWCDRHGIEVKAHTEGVNSAGGFLVPDEFETELISLREQFGVFRNEARIRPMKGDTLRIPRRGSTLSASFVGEAAAGTESTMTFEQVMLVAKKAMVLTTVSSELNEDAFVNLADDVAGEIAYAFAKKEDECGFIGDGTSTYGGIQGVADALANGTENFQYVDHGAATITGVTAATVSAMMALLPQYADTPNCKFYMHKSTWHAGFADLLLDAGGNTGRDLQAGFAQPTFLGYPVVFTQAMLNGSQTQSADGIAALFGDLSLAASFGDRRQTTIQISEHASVGGESVFERDELAVRGTERFDINVHDIGDGSESGPIVGLRLDIA
jgi:HK97 family phage major capsid protein